MLLIELSKDMPRLAAAEARALASGMRLSGDVALAERLAGTPAYTRRVLEVIRSCPAARLLDTVRAIAWDRHVRGSFAVLESPSRKTVADIVFRSLARPAVDLDRPRTRIVVREHKGRCYICRLVWENPRDYETRKPHLRPGFHPSSLHPKLARAAVNLLGPGKKTVVDPFCGTGGILLEAAILGHRVVGYDTSRRMLQQCSRNLKHYRVQGYVLRIKDALCLDLRHSHVVTDLPYGRNTSCPETDALYMGFLQRLAMSRTRHSVVMFPDFYDFRKGVRQAGLEVAEHFTYYLHKSLSKIIAVLRNPSRNR